MNALVDEQTVSFNTGTPAQRENVLMRIQERQKELKKNHDL